ncbi:hypothetical protein BJV82DRAFT_674609 [Fennellomyces sp. T-0311]|nr:hypothetical protein BJV82DRAFT_674609 [Fennellomyces sp. T-0311]
MKSGKYNAKYRLVEYTPGSQVMVKDETRRNKMDPKYEGLYTVVRKTKGGSYVLRDEQGLLTSRNYAPSQLKLLSQDALIDTSETYEKNGKYYTIQSIVDHNELAPGKYEYRVRWKDYSPSDDTWEPPVSFNSPLEITKYWERVGNKATEQATTAASTTANATTQRQQKRKQTCTWSQDDIGEDETTNAVEEQIYGRILQIMEHQQYTIPRVARMHAEYAGKMKKDYDKHSQPRKYQLYDRVMVRNHAIGSFGAGLAPHWVGPYQIYEKLGRDVYRLKDGHLVLPTVVHADQMKLYVNRPKPHSGYQALQRPRIQEMDDLRDA